MQKRLTSVAFFLCTLFWSINSLADNVLWLPLENDGTRSRSWVEEENPAGEITVTHSGIDYSIPESTQIFAPVTGIVKHVTRSFSGQTDSGNYGNYVTIETVVNGSTYRVYTAHMKTDSIVVSEETCVIAGEYIGLSGNTGYTLPKGSGYHLHFELKKLTEVNGTWQYVSINPDNYWVDEPLERGDASSDCGTENQDVNETEEDLRTSALTSRENADLQDLNPYAGYSNNTTVASKLGSHDGILHQWYGGTIEYTDGVPDDAFVQDYTGGSTDAAIIVHPDSAYAVETYREHWKVWMGPDPGVTIVNNCTGVDWFPNGHYGPSSSFGLPITGIYYTNDNKRYRQDFQRGYLAYDATKKKMYENCYTNTTPGWQEGFGWHGEISAAIARAYERNGAKEMVGWAYDNGSGSEAHIWGSVIIQDFTGEGFGDNAVIVNLYHWQYETEVNRASVVRGAFWDYYTDHNGGVDIGAPLGDEMDTESQNGSLVGYDPICDTDQDGWNNSSEREACIDEYCGSDPDYGFTSMQRFEGVTLCYDRNWLNEVVMFETANDGGYGIQAVNDDAFDLTCNCGAESIIPVDPSTFIWTSQDLQSSVASEYADTATTPSAVISSSTGEQFITYTGWNARIYTFRSENGGDSWTVEDNSSHASVLLAEPGTSPATGIDPETGNRLIVFSGEHVCGGRIQLLQYDVDTEEAESKDLQSAVDSPCVDQDSSPFLFFDVFTGDIHILYNAVNKRIEDLVSEDGGATFSLIDWSGRSSVLDTLPATSPVMVQDLFTGDRFVSFNGDGVYGGRTQLLREEWSTGTVTSQDVHSVVNAPYMDVASNPSGYVDWSTGDLHIQFQADNRRIEEFVSEDSGTTWNTLSDLSGLVSVPFAETGTSPVSLQNPHTGQRMVLFSSENARANAFIQGEDGTLTAVDVSGQTSVLDLEQGTNISGVVDPVSGGYVILFNGDGLYGGRIQYMRYGPPE